MKLTIITAAALALIAAMAPDFAVGKSAKTGAVPRDRFFDAAHGPNDPHSVWSAGDYIGRDPDLAIRAAMIREHHNH